MAAVHPAVLAFVISKVNGWRSKSGSANIMLGVEVALRSVVDAITQAAEQGGLSSDDFPRMHVGLALAGAEQKEAWHAFMQQAHPFASITLNTDAYGACLGAHLGEEARS